MEFKVIKDYFQARNYFRVVLDSLNNQYKRLGYDISKINYKYNQALHAIQIYYIRNKKHIYYRGMIIIPPRYYPILELYGNINNKKVFLYLRKSLYQKYTILALRKQKRDIAKCGQRN